MLRFISVILFMVFTSLSAYAVKQKPDYGTDWDLFATPGAIAFQNKTVFMTWPSGHCKGKKIFAIIDVSVATNPKLLGCCPIGGFPQDMILTKTHAYVVNGKELLTIDITHLASPKMVARTLIADDPLRGPQGIDIAGRYAYLACRKDGIKIVDLGEPASPVVVKHISLPGFSRDVTVANKKIYVASGTRGVLIIDLLQPIKLGKPIRLGIQEGVINRIVIRDSIAYLAAGNLLVACVSEINTNNPSWVGKSSNRGILTPFYGAYCFDLAVQGFDNNSKKIMVFSADGEGGIIATDVTNPDKPKLSSALMDGVSFGNAHFFTAIAIDKNFAYINDAWFGLRVVDIRNPKAMKLVGTGLKVKP